MSKEVTIEGTNSLSQKSTSKKYMERSSATGGFVSAKTGRIVKSSPVEPRLGKKRIQAAVRDYVRRDARTGEIRAK